MSNLIRAEQLGSGWKMIGWLSIVTPFIAISFYSVGVGALLTYGSYLPSNISIPKSAVAIGLVDTAVALLAGIAISPLVFAFDLNPESGRGSFLSRCRSPLAKCRVGDIARFYDRRASFD